MLPIIPVIDLRGGQVVRGVGGRRDEYRPIVSQLTPSSEPGEVAQALVAKFGFRTMYVADLEAIAGSEPDYKSYERIRAAGLELWIDAGVRRVMALAEHGDVVLGLESLAGPAALAETLQQMPDSERVLFSLDLKLGQPWTTASIWRKMSALQIVEQAVNAGVKRVIVLDVATVGTKSGPSTLLLGAELLRRWPNLTLIGGGGVRNTSDVAEFCAAGYAQVLVASALHDGAIAPDLPGRSDGL